MPKIKKIIINFSLFLVSLIISLIILEIILTVFFKEADYVDHSISPPRLKPNIISSFYVEGRPIEIKSNSEGLRTNEYEKNIKNPNRILLIGDSFTFGFTNFNDTYGNLLEQKLKKDNIDYEVVAAGFPGFSIIQEKDLMKQLLPVYKPGKVILFFVNNDPDENLRDLEGYKEPEKDTRWFKKTRNLLWEVKGYIFSKSDFIRNRSHNLRCILRKVGLASDPSFYYAVYNNNKGGIGWNVTLENLKLIKNELEKNNIKFYLVAIPQRYLVNVNEWEEYKKNNCIRGDEINFSNPGFILKTFAEKEEIPFLDLKDYLVNESNAYNNYDGHLNKIGNNITSYAIYTAWFKNK